MTSLFVEQSSGAVLIVKDELKVNSLNASIIRLPFIEGLLDNQIKLQDT